MKCAEQSNKYPVNFDRVLKGKIAKHNRNITIIIAYLDSDLSTLQNQAMAYPGLSPIMLSSMPPSGAPPSSSYGSGRGPVGNPAAGSPFAPMHYAQNPYLAAVGPYGAPGGQVGMQGVGPGAMAAPPYAGPLGLEAQQKETVYVYIPNSAVGAIIGTGGSAIRDMINQSGATIKVAQAKEEGGSPTLGSGASGGQSANERKVTIQGVPEAQWKAQFMLFRKVGYEGQSGPQEAVLTVEILVPSSQVGRIIGKSGQTVRELQRLTRAAIKLPEEGSLSSDQVETPVQIKGDFLSTQVCVE